MKTLFLFSSFVLSSFATSTSWADSWNGQNNPANFSDQYNYSFDQLPMQGEVDASHIPWSDNYWESDWSGIALRWNTLTVAQRDPDLFDYRTVNKEALFEYQPPSLAQLKTMSRDELINLSPAEKFDIAMGRYDYPTVKSERARTDPGMKDWQGICHGWVPAALNEPEPQPTDVPNFDGLIVPFGSSDLKALLSYYYGITAYSFARGSRKIVRNGSLFQVLDRVDAFDPTTWVNLMEGALVFNGSGRVIQPSSLSDSAVCADPVTAAHYGSTEKCIEAFSIGGTVDSLDEVSQVGLRRSSDTDPNAGAVFIIMANQLGLIKQGFAANLNRFGKSSEIWNQPVSGYTNHLDYDHRGPNGGEVGITTELEFVTEIPQNFKAVIGTPFQRFAKMTYSYSLEINSSGKITGGNWIRGVHPGFIWKHNGVPVKGYFTPLNTILHAAR